ncbi:MFS multidrug transporter [Penicillium angulare]|uniref:MFS multidrug transporter n=1 Tax=Penicillium angulare TaxID=116970 RepID=A0A9W9FAZ0_9EURO|nr:MFS multidrug transporter [Penicillium angulare]
MARIQRDSVVDEPRELSEATHDEKTSAQLPAFPVMNLDEGVVGWDGQDDPENPRNFTSKKKSTLVLVVSSITFLSPLASSMFAPALGSLAKDFHITEELLLSFTVSIYVLDYVVGPLVLSPLSEIYGRRIVLSVANWFFVVWQIGCALAPNERLLIFFRLMSGIGGSGCLTLGAGLIADLYASGRYVEVSSARVSHGASGVVSAAIDVFNCETYHEILIRRKTERLRKELNRPELKSCYDASKDPMSETMVVRRAFIRPFKLLFKSPIVFILCLYLSTIYGILYLLFITISDVFIGQYCFSEGLSGLSYLGMGVGFIFGVLAVAMTSDRMVVKMTKKNNGISEPEMRLPAVFIYASFLPVGLIWYGWTADKHVHWIAPIIGLAPLGFGMMGVFLPIQTYLIDSYDQYAASAIAALTVTRSLVGAFLPLAGPSMYASLGLGWGNTLLGLLCVIFIPVPIALYKYGKVIREKFPVDL